MEGQEMMTINQAILAVVHTVGTVIAREITSITTACHSTISYLHPFSSIVAKHFMEISVLICEPFLHDLASGVLSLFRFHFGVSFSRIIVLYISLICSIFKEQVIGFWVFRVQHSMSF